MSKARLTLYQGLLKSYGDELAIIEQRQALTDTNIARLETELALAIGKREAYAEERAEHVNEMHALRNLIRTMETAEANRAFVEGAPK